MMTFLNSFLFRFTLAGFLLGVGFVVSGLWFCGFLGVWVFVWAVDESNTKKQFILGGLWTWFVKMLLVHSWGVSIYPIDWYKPELPLDGLWGIVIYWILGSLFLSFGGVVLAALIRVARFYALGKKWLYIAIAWVCCETLNAYVFSILTLGENSYISDYYSYGQLGYLASEHSFLIQLASFGGVYALTLTSVLLVGLGCYLFKKIKYWLIPVFFLFVLVGLVSGLFKYEVTGKTVALVETDFDQRFLANDKEFSQHKKIEEAIDAAVLNQVEYLVLPEASQYTNLNFKAEGAYNLYRFRNKDTKTVLVDSGQAILPNGKAIIRATIYDGVEKKAWQFDKQYLVPQGEYMPAVFSLIFNIIDLDGDGALVDRVNYVPGPIVGQGGVPSHLPKVLFCFSSADPKAAKRLVGNSEVPFVAHITSHAWFHNPTILWQQQTAMLKIQAVWSGVPIMQSANMGRAMVYLPNGVAYRPSLLTEGERWRVFVTEI